MNLIILVLGIFFKLIIKFNIIKKIISKIFNKVNINFILLNIFIKVIFILFVSVINGKIIVVGFSLFFV